jgi:putative ABC transport system substrate-binding protein
LRSEAQRETLEVASAAVSERAGLYPALQELIPRSDLFLLLPDPVAVNADTVYGLLLTTYRAGVPVVGFSEGLLNAGALVSLFSTAQQQGRQGADLARRVLAHESTLPEPQYPRQFTVRVNASVARSLGLHVPGEQLLHDDLAARRGEPGGAP